MQICSENKRLSPFFSAPKSKLDGIRPRFLERPSRFCVGAIGRVFLLAQSRSAVVLPGHFPALPVIALAFFAGISRRLSIADLTLAGLASGAGFGFVEGNLNALVTGTLPHFQSLAGFNFDAVQRIASDYTVNFAGHCVYPALFGLAAGIGLRLYPVRRDCAWIPAALVFVLASFDHAMFNWKIAHPGMGVGGNFLDAPRAVEILYWST